MVDIILIRAKPYSMGERMAASFLENVCNIFCLYHGFGFFKWQKIHIKINLYLHTWNAIRKDVYNNVHIFPGDLLNRKKESLRDKI